MLQRLAIISSLLFTIGCGSDYSDEEFQFDEGGQFDVADGTNAAVEPDPETDPEPEPESEELETRTYRNSAPSVLIAGSGPTPSSLELLFDLPGRCLEIKLVSAYDLESDPNPFQVDVNATREVNLFLADIVTDGRCGEPNDRTGERVESATGLITTGDAGIKLDVTVKLQSEDFYRRVVLTDFLPIYF